MMNIQVGGKTIQAPDGANVSVINDKVYINNVLVTDFDSLGPIKLERVVITGNIGELKAAGSVEVSGNVTGSVDAGGSAKVGGNVGGKVDAGGSVQCNDVGGGVNAGGSIKCNTVKGG